MTDNQKEIVRIWDEADTSGKQLIFDLLACAVACGEPFYTEMQSHLDRKDKDAMRACVAKYKALLRGGGLQYERSKDFTACNDRARGSYSPLCPRKNRGNVQSKSLVRYIQRSQRNGHRQLMGYYEFAIFRL